MRATTQWLCSSRRGLLVGLALAACASAAGSHSGQPSTNVSSAAEGPYDLVIRQGRVMDPDSGFDGIADLALRGDRIVAIAKGLPAGRREIDAKGLVVAPGFIDLHAHDINAQTSRLHALDGVTT